MGNTKKNKEKKPWMRFRHRVARNIAYAVLYPYTKIRYHINAEPFREQGDRAYLILMNHQTPFDQFFVGISFKEPVYYVATEDIFSNGFVSSLIRWLVAPIPIQKKKNDIGAVIKCIRVAREGGTIAIAPEGNRTFSGRTEYMRPSIAALARRIGLPIALYRIEGGYGVQPRWSDGARKGRMHSSVTRVIEPEEYAGMSDEELFANIKEGLFVDEAKPGGLFRSKKKAEYLERAMYVCPFCGLSEFKSKGDEAWCLKCGRKLRYGEDKRITGVGYDFPYEYVGEWYDHQKEFVNGINPMDYLGKEVYSDSIRLSEVIVYKNKRLISRETTIKLFGDRITIGDNEGKDTKEGGIVLELRFDDIADASVMGHNKINIYHKDKIYQIKGSKSFNALKYVNFCYRYKNYTQGDENGKFLGL